MFKSIKTRLFIWLITFFTVIMAVLGVFLYNRLDNIVLETVDHLLSDKSEILKSLVHVEKKEVEFEISEVTGGDYSLVNSGHYFELIDDRGDVLVKSKSLGDSTLTSVKGKGIYAMDGPAGEPIRLLIEEFSVNNEKFYIYVAEGTRAELNLLRSFKLFLFIVLPLAILFSGIGSIAITWLSLRPLASFSDQVGTITEKRLHERVDTTGVDAELKELASSFNETMDRLEKAFRTQREFLSDASHELRTPVTVIRSAAQLALRKERSVDEYKEALESVKTASERMGRLVDKLLRLSRLDAGQIAFKQEKVNLRKIVENAVGIITPLAKERDITVNLDRAEDVIVEGDEEQLTELVLSILDNSIKYNRPKGSVDLSITMAGDWGIVKLTDTGIGIAPDAIDKIFDRFYRADLSRGEIPGTGLGLPIAKGIAESHGGRIEVKSEVGKGTTFLIYLPLAK